MNLRSIFSKRDSKSHKGDFGKLLVVGGSREYTGAPALAALAALKTGCDLVSILAPRRAADTIASFSPNLITYPVQGDYLDKQSIKTIEKISSNTIVFGNGLGENSKKLCETIWKLKKPCVVDGDALKFIDRKLSKNFILTPHSGEFALMTQEKISNNLEDRKQLVKEYAKGTNTVILLKGYTDIISDGYKPWFNHQSPLASVKLVSSL